jgi:anti-anti-sigma factor
MTADPGQPAVHEGEERPAGAHEAIEWAARFLELREGWSALEEERFRRVFQRGQVGMAVIQPGDFRLTDVNEALCRMLGYSRRELLGLTLSEITHPDDVGADGALVRQVFAGQLPSYQLEKRFVTKQGEVVWTNLAVSVVKDGEGQVRYGLGIVEDITERKRANALVKLHTTLLEMVASGRGLDELLDALVAGLQEQIRTVLACVLLAGDRSRPRVATASSLPAALVEAIEGADRLPWTSAAGGQRLLTVTDLSTISEAIGTAASAHGLRSCWCVPVRSAGGALLGGVAVFCPQQRGPDAYERALLDLAGRVAGLAIERHRDERARTMLATIIENSSDFVWVADASGRTLYINAAGRSMMGFGPDEDLSDVTILDYLPERVREHFAAVVLPAAMRDGAWRGRMPLLGRDGRQVITSQLVLAHKAPDGRLDYFSAVARDLTSEQQAELTAKLYEHEREIAQTLQRSLLPDELPDVPGLTLAARYLPGAAGIEIGGDWYDVFPLPDGRVGLAVGDVVGRGTHAATTMGQLRTALRAYALECDSPAEAVTRLNRLVQALDPTLMATLVYATVDPVTRTACYSVAGHPPPLLWSPGGAAAFLEQVRSVPLGVPGKPAGEAMARLEPGAMLLLYTDGLVERRDAPIDERLEALREAVAASGLETGDCEALCDHLVITFAAAQSEDDVAILAVGALPTGDRFALALPAESHALVTLRRQLRRWLADRHVDPDTSQDIVLACNEAAANVIEHAYGPGDASFDVEADLADGTVTIVVRDTGRWRPPRGGDKGRGLAMMRALVDQVDVTKSPHGTEVRLRRHLGTARLGSREVHSHPRPGTIAAEALSRPQIPVLRLTEDLDLSSAERVGGQLLDSLPNDALGVVLDLSALPFIDSSGIRLLFHLAVRLHRRRQHLCVVVPADSWLRRLLSLSDLDRQVSIAPTIDAALAEVHANADLRPEASQPS